MNLQHLKGVFRKEGKTIFPEHRELVRQLGADGMVLLKNNDMLPLTRGKIALFGAGAVDTVFCGQYYNYVYTDKNVNVKDGLANNGFTFSTDTWLEKMEKAMRQVEKSNKKISDDRFFNGRRETVPEVPISVADMAEAILGTDTCVYILRHRPAEHSLLEEDYRLTEVEQENLKLVSSSFKKVVLVINGGMVEIASIARTKSIRAIIYMGLPGMEAGNSLADILTGISSPSGRLSITWAKKYKDYSTCMNTSHKKGTIEEINYKEGIYVGYRYFDAFDVAPLYPFGYGLSYTEFTMEATYFEASWMGIILRVKVTNTGNAAGREVVQMYCSQPQGNLEKPYQMLTSFAKTGKLKPGESEEVSLKVPIMPLTQFDVDIPAWVMEKGDYLFRIGSNSRNTKVCAKLVLDQTTIIKRVTDIKKPTKKLDFITPPEREPEDTGYIFAAQLSGRDYNSENKEVHPTLEFTTYVPEGSSYVSYVNNNSYDIPFRAKERVEYIRPCGTTTLFDVIKGKVSIQEFVSSLPPEVLACIVAGEVDEKKVNSKSRLNFDISLDRNNLQVAARTTSQFATSLGIPGVTIADGPSGLHLKGKCCTCFPAPINMAQTWDMSSMVRMGRAYGREMEYYGIDYCLAPALNIIRNPMQNRIYEFYSEDPTLSGVVGSGFIMGIKRYEGRNAIVKHLPTYNQENDMADININIEQKVFGELYLRPFSACMFTAQPAGFLMTSNKINGNYATAQRWMNTNIVRNDWGFKGFLLSDWGSWSEKPYDLRAGCDLIMPGYDPDKILEAMMEVEPTFTSDGYVEVVKKAHINGLPMICYEKWGSFLLDKSGKDNVVTYVAADVELNPQVIKKQEQGLCRVEAQPDGSKIVTYIGINRGAFFALGELQNAAINVLSEIKNSAAMKRLMDKANI